MDEKAIIYDHFKESFNLNRESQKRRNKSFIIICCLEALSFLLLIRPEKVIIIIESGISKQMDASIQLGITIVQTLLWLMLGYAIIRYIQDMLYIERQYKYLDKVEKELNTILSSNIFNREGKDYQKDYPIVLNLIDLFYKMFMPIMIEVINSIRIIAEWRKTSKNNVAVICDTVLFWVIFLIVWFYFFEIHSKITVFLKTHVPIIGKMSKIIRKILKEV